MSLSGHAVEWVSPTSGVALVGRFSLTRGMRYVTHTHPLHQLVWARSGVVTVGVADTTWVLPPSRALFIPAGVPHTTAGASVADMHSLYLRRERCPALWTVPTVLAAVPMLAALIGHLSGPLPEEARGRAEAVLFDVLEPAPVASAELTWPRDDRAVRVADALAADPTDPHDAAGWARLVGTSERTLSRLFVAETGVGFGRWRTRLRVRAALELLAAGTPVAVVGRRVGYGTTSAFIAAFRREVGITPARCFGS
ncbi:AraC family transcriptional regulator [Actinophytocola oryzae]|uniref:HTH-type transcriptional regulator RipA n=1 Tax=Actinophytocola oryzae TaxID=502181 RepID=A0A4R7VY10_9PSEU|nr:helix-turn-helix transcriptional regulator [Actinophytocola oryzae]TDV54107.1 AraC-like DNA-binding protein [Actinophytocola oryzae]